MCGIVGFHFPNCRPDLVLLRRMNATLVHRGPDGEGYFTDGLVGLATRYLPYSEQTPSLSTKIEPFSWSATATPMNKHPVGGRWLNPSSSLITPPA